MHRVSFSQKAEFINKSVSPRCRFGFSSALQLVGMLLCFGIAGAAQAAAPTFAKVFAPSTIGPGNISTITFTIDNSLEASGATSLSFTDTLPANVTVAAPAQLSSDCGTPTLSATEGSDTISMSGGTVGAFSACTLTVNVTSATAGTYTNPAITLTSSTGSSLSTAVDLTVSNALPGFSKGFSPASVNLGQRSTLTFTIDNSSNAALIGTLDFTDNLPSGMVVASPANASTDCEGVLGTTLTAVAGSGVITLDANGFASAGFEALAAGASCTVDVDVVASSVGLLANTAELLADVVSAGMAGAALDVSTDELTFYKSFTDDPVTAGTTATLRYDIINTNRFNPATAIAFDDVLGTMLSGTTVAGVLSDTCNGLSSGTSTFSYSGGSVAADGGACAIEISLNIPSGAAEGIYPSTTSPITANSGTFSAASDSLFVYAAPLISKSFTDDPVVAGGTVTLEYTITNPSATDAMTAISFFDEYSLFLGFPVSATIPAGEPCGIGSSMVMSVPGTDRHGLTLSAGTIAASGSCTFSISIDIPAGFSAGSFISTSEQVSGVIAATTRTGNQATDSLVVVSAPSFSKSFTDASVAPGGSATLEFNLGLSASAPGDVSSIAFSDNVATMLTGTTVNSVLSDTCGGTPSGVGGGVFNYTSGLLTPGASCTVSILLDVDAAATPGTYPNSSSTITALADDGTTATHAVTGPAATDDLLVTGLVFSKAFIDDPALPNGTATLRYTLDNTAAPGGQDATAIGFTDTLGETLSSLAATVLPANDTCGAGSSMTGTTTLIYSGGSVAAGTSCTLDVTVTIPGGAADNSYPSSTSSLTATIGATGVVLPPATDSLIVQSENITLSKSFTDDPLAVGGTGTLEFVLGVLATSPGTVDNIGFTDNLDATLTGLTYSVGSTDCPGLTLASGSMVTVSGVSLAPGASCTITLDLAVPGTASAGDYSNSTSALSGDIGGLPVTGPAATDTMTVRAATLSLSFGSSGQSTGTVGLSFTIQNEDSVAGISGLSFSDNLSAALTGLVSITPSQADVCGAGSLFSGTSLLTLSNGTLGAGASCTINVTLQIPATTPGSYLSTTSSLLSSGLAVYSPASATLSVINSAPVITSDGGGATAVINAAENQSAVTTVTNTDANPADGHTFSISGGADSARFSINSSSGVLTFASAPDFETPSDSGADNVYNVQVTVTDDSTNPLSDVQDIAVSVTDVNEAPVITSDGGAATAAINAAENQIAVTTVTNTDVDTADSHTFTISGGADSTRFSINGSSGVLTFISAPDFETPTDSGTNNVYDVQVTVTDDGTGTLTDVQDIAVTVTDANEVPVITSDGGAANAAINAAENQTAVTTVTETDVDTADSHTFTISGGADSASFSINSTSGVLTFASAPDFESPADSGNDNVYDVQVTVTDDGTGNLTDVQDIAVSVTDVNEAPTISGTPTLSTSAEALYSFIPTASDVDASTTLTFSIVNKPTWASFNTATGELSGTPAAGDVGTATTGIVISVSDGSLSASLASFDLAVIVNVAPTIGGTPATGVGDDVAYSFTPTSNDGDGDTLTFSIVNQPTWASFDTATGALTGTPVTADIGTTTGIVISVTDGIFNVDLTAFDLEVYADLDNDNEADSVDLDIDGDGMSNAYEDANGLDKWDATDRDTDLDGDGVSNYDEWFAGTLANADDYPPLVTAPADITVDAVGLFTPASTGMGSAVDALDGPITPTSDAPTHFKPGVHTVTWSATDAAGNTGTATQMVNVTPQVSFSKDQITAEGATVSFSVILNGDAVSYPVTVPYSVSGTADGSDHDLINGSVDITSGTEVVVSFATVADALSEGSESIVITMGSPTNAVVGPKTTHTVTLVEGNVAPLLSLSADQAPVGGTRIVTKTGGNVQVIASVSDANVGDSHTYDWSATDNALIDTDGVVGDGSFTFNPSTVTAGLYTLRLTVTDSGGATAEAELKLNVVPAPPVLSALDDSDGDTIDDLSEGYGDTDNDGIPDYLDAIATLNVLQEQGGQSASFLLETEPGLNIVLNRYAMQANTGQASVDMSDVSNGGGNIDNANRYAYPGGLFDFIVTGLPVAGQLVNVVVPQQVQIPTHAVYRKLLGGVWQDFVEDGNNVIASAAGAEGFCPPPGDVSYTPGLTEGHWCVQLTIEDGGANDNDHRANKRVVDPGGVAEILAVAVNVEVRGGGGGALHPLWLLLALFAVPALVAARKGRAAA